MKNQNEHDAFSHIYCPICRRSTEYMNKLLDIARKCAEIIEKSGIPAYDAEEIPYILYDEIVRDNYHLTGQKTFRTFPPDSVILDELENQ